MAKGFEASTVIARPPAAVWAVMTDFVRAPDWMPGIETVAAKDESPLAAGKVFDVGLSTRGRGRQRDMTLVCWEPESRVFALSSSEGTVTALYRYSLHPKDDDTLVRLEASCEGGGFFMKLLSPLIVRMMAKHDSRQMPLLKALAEQSPQA